MDPLGAVPAARKSARLCKCRWSITVHHAKLSAGQLPGGLPLGGSLFRRLQGSGCVAAAPPRSLRSPDAGGCRRGREVNLREAGARSREAPEGEPELWLHFCCSFRLRFRGTAGGDILGPEELVRPS